MVALEKLNLEKDKKRKDTSKNIFLLDRKIAKKISDEKNKMTIHIYRLKDNDASATKEVIYHDRVGLWFSNPKLALEQKKFVPMMQVKLIQKHSIVLVKKQINMR